MQRIVFNEKCGSYFVECMENMRENNALNT